MSTDVDRYLAQLPPDRREALERVRDVIREAVPGATESLAHRMPTWSIDGEIVCALAAQKRHLALYLCAPALLERHRGALSGLDLGKGCIRFSRFDALPLDTVRTILQEAADEAPEHRAH